jgi:hypothetical protein
MYITDISTLGTDYSIADLTGRIVGAVQVIPYNEILDATAGLYTEEFGDFSSYLRQCNEMLTGFDSINPSEILWHATTDENINLMEVIEYSIKNGYHYIILEHLENLDN